MKSVIQHWPRAVGGLERAKRAVHASVARLRGKRVLPFGADERDPLGYALRSSAVGEGVLASCRKARDLGTVRFKIHRSSTRKVDF